MREKLYYGTLVNFNCLGDELKKIGSKDGIWLTTSFENAKQNAIELSDEEDCDRDPMVACFYVDFDEHKSYMDASQMNAYCFEELPHQIKEGTFDIMKLPLFEGVAEEAFVEMLMKKCGTEGVDMKAQAEEFERMVKTGDYAEYGIMDAELEYPEYSFIIRSMDIANNAILVDLTEL